LNILFILRLYLPYKIRKKTKRLIL